MTAVKGVRTRKWTLCPFVRGARACYIEASEDTFGRCWRFRSCDSDEFRSPKFVHPVERSPLTFLRLRSAWAISRKPIPSSFFGNAPAIVRSMSGVPASSSFPATSRSNRWLARPRRCRVFVRCSDVLRVAAAHQFSRLSNGHLAMAKSR
jgi:hypothetical protein